MKQQQQTMFNCDDRMYVIMIVTRSFGLNGSAGMNLHVVIEFVSARQNLQTDGTLMNWSIRVQLAVLFVAWNGMFRVLVVTEATYAREMRGRREWIF